MSSVVAEVPSNAALERVLREVAINIRSQQRVTAVADETVVLDELAIVYVVRGSIVPAPGSGFPETLAAGDALLAAGTSTTVRIPAGSEALVSHLEWADSAVHLARLLPEAAWISHFDQLEPAAAALAQHMDGGTLSVCDRGGDVICRTMATTLLQSVIRAWTTLECSPEGWPGSKNDPFLERVVEAVNSEPGREWTVEQMAAISALSRSVFAERFRIAFGLSPALYVAEVRMRAARALLIDGRGVSEVSRSLGYGSDEGFSRAFRRHTGLTPSAWRARSLLAKA